MPEQTTAWRDAKELEYARINSALEDRRRLTAVRSPDAIAQNPFTLFSFVEADLDIWECFSAYYKGDKRRDEMEKRLEALQSSALKIFDHLRVRREIGEDKIRDFFGDERSIYRDIMDMRHEKGLDIGFKQDSTPDEKKTQLRSYAKGGGV